MDYLEISEGVEIEVIGRGESMPLGDDDNKNRRVEVEVKK